MEERKALKNAAAKSVKKNYWAMVAVCFIMAIIVGRYSLSSMAVYQYNNHVQYTKRVLNDDGPITGWNYLNKLTKNHYGITTDEMLEQYPHSKAVQFISCAVINVATEGYKYILEWVLALDRFFTFKDKMASFTFFLGGIAAAVFYIFIGNILWVGEKRFFLERRLYPGTKISRIGYLYKNVSLLNATWVITLQNIRQFLWNFTIIGGIIKMYEYRMIPYLMAENPSIRAKDAFKLSRQMIQGHKWHTFILDLSFAGWIVLQILTLGFVGILYVNPYYTATMTEWYMHLREEAVSQKKQGYELLNDVYLTHLPSQEEWELHNGYLS